MSISETGTIRVSRRLSAPPERAFDAWLDPSVTRRWLFATPGGKIVRCDIDARPGGAFVITDRRDGEDVEHVGTYVEIERPRRLVFTFAVPKYSGEKSTVEIVVTADTGGTEVTIDTRDVPLEWREQTEQGWRELLGRLDDVLHA
jgi:uncharacterized protein YndB with AHSA1/START domain